MVSADHRSLISHTTSFRGRRRWLHVKVRSGRDTGSSQGYYNITMEKVPVMEGWGIRRRTRSAHFQFVVHKGFQTFQDRGKMFGHRIPMKWCFTSYTRAVHQGYFKWSARYDHLKPSQAFCVHSAQGPIQSEVVCVGCFSCYVWTGVFSCLRAIRSLKHAV